MRKANILLLIVAIFISLIGCSQIDEMVSNDTNEPASSFSAGEATATPPSNEGQDDPSTKESQPIESVAPGNTEKPADSTPPATSETQSKPNLQQETSAPTNNQPAETQQPTNSTPPPVDNTPPPTNPPATTTPTQPEQPTKPTYTDADVQTIINTIIDYGKAQGFILVESYTFEQGHQYYGRPNLQDDGYNGTIEMLKYHIDKIKRDTDVCYFNVVKHIYQGKTEIVVIYD